MGNANLHNAKNEQAVEFYTLLSDIVKELNNYTDKFEGKVVFCNCDDPFESNFVKYFLMNFNRLGLKELIATGYSTSPIRGTELNIMDGAYVIRVTDTKRYLVGTQKDLDAAGAKYFLTVEKDKIATRLIGNPAVDKDGNPIQVAVKEKYVDDNGKTRTRTIKHDVYYEPGDFRSNMSVELLKQSDIVVTNPPFALFREYVAQLMEYEKQFLIIGNMNAITYKEFFPYIRDDKIWLGVTNFNTGMYFYVPQGFQYKPTYKFLKEMGGKAVNRVAGCCWFTNIDHLKRHTHLPLDLGYVFSGHEDMYPKYDNYDAININKVEQIPSDYFGVMGVPITFLDKCCPEQFEIIDCTHTTNPELWSDKHDISYYKDFKRGKIITNADASMPIMATDICGGTKCIRQTDGAIIYQLYHRLFIRRKDTNHHD